MTGHGADVTSLNHGLLKKLKKRCLKNAWGVTSGIPKPLMDVLDGIYKNENQAVISRGAILHFSDGSIVKRKIFWTGKSKRYFYLSDDWQKKKECAMPLKH